MPVELTRRAALLALLAQGLLAAGCKSGSPAARVNAKPGAISLGVLSPNLVSAIHFIAKKTGAYEKNGLTVTERLIPSGESSAGIEELLRGHLDVFIGAGAEVARVNSVYVESNRPAPIAVIQGGTAGASSLVLRRDLEGKSLDDLKTQPLRIAVSSPSSIHLALFRAFLLERYPTSANLQWQFLNMEGGNMAPMLTAKELDGFLHSEPAASSAISSRVGFLFMSAKRGDMGARAKIVPITFTNANRAWLENNKETADRFMAALNDANMAFATMPKAQMVDIMAEWAKLPNDIASLAYERLDPRMNMTFAGAQAWWDVIGRVIRDRGEIGSRLQFNDLFGTSYLLRDTSSASKGAA